MPEPSKKPSSRKNWDDEDEDYEVSDIFSNYHT
jgi:hypothetical protein